MATRYRPAPRRRPRRPSPILVIGPLALAVALLVSIDESASLPLPAARPPAADTEAAQFRRCGIGARDNCVIDGDTFRYGGEKIRIADINAPEVGTPQCAGEAALGEKATRRLQALLNAGPFSLEPVDRDRDRYGRLLREVTRGGESLGAELVAEGVAERWKGYRGSWC